MIILQIVGVLALSVTIVALAKADKTDTQDKGKKS